MLTTKTKLFFLLVSLCSLLSCAQSGSKYAYGYYTGKKKPGHTILASPARVIQVSPSDYHVVEKGETLYSIAWAYGHDVRDVANWNNIRTPYTIYPKQKIRVKPSSETVTRRKYSHRPSPTVKSAPAKKTATHYTKSTPQKTQKSGKIHWQWPTKGKIIGKYSARDSGKKGLDIAGKQGQKVFSAAVGEVVYVGSGLRGYGKLIILKHNETYFSAYAHNSRLFVREKQKVKRGQHIADMGSDEAERAMLHFEVRRNGKPVDPLKYLPRRR